MRDVAPRQPDLACGRFDHAGEKSDQRRLAGPVGSDQRLPGAGLNRERHIVGRGQGAETAYEAARLERRSAHAAPRPAARGGARAISPQGPAAIRSRPASTRMTKASPIQNSQYSGVAPEIASLSTMNAAAPIGPPYRYPAPPMMSISMTSADRWKSNRSSETICVVCASSAPAAPGCAAAIV